MMYYSFNFLKTKSHIYERSCVALAQMKVQNAIYEATQGHLAWP